MTTEESAEPKEDTTKVLESKFTAMDDQIKAMNDNFKQLTETLIMSQARQQQPPAEEKPDYENMSGEELEARLAARTASIIDSKLAESQKKSTALQNTLIELHSDYPELSKNTSDLSKAMVDAHKKLPKHLQETPEGYKMATLLAAQQTGTLPKARRTSNDSEDFVLGSSNSSSDGGKKKGGSEKLSESVLINAQMFGLDVTDPKVVERLKEYNKRNFNKYR